MRITEEALKAAVDKAVKLGWEPIQLAEDVLAILETALAALPATNMQSRGGRARADSLTPEQRSAIARGAALARWRGAGRAAAAPRTAP